jgi:predicted nuclease of restriction endonuclease-like (RecB) superfamily
MKPLSQKIILLVEQSHSNISRITNSTIVSTYFIIGKMIVEEYQSGNIKASYGKNIMKSLSEELTIKIGRGYSVDNLENMRKFYLNYQSQFSISETHSRILYLPEISEKLSRKFDTQLLTWSHYVLLSKIKNSEERRFYEIESLKNNWNISELKRQFNSALYERLCLSRNQEEVGNLALKGQEILNPKDLFKEPFVLEFLNIPKQVDFSENELEKAIISEIQDFMLELGRDFYFGGRQVRFTFDEDHFFVDLVFFNRILNCFVLIDLKLGKLTHQDLGQMQMYVNYFDRYEKKESENPTIGVVLCKSKSQSLVEITLSENNQQIFAANYLTILPSKNEFKKILEHYKA